MTSPADNDSANTSDPHGLPINRWNPHAWIVGEPDVDEGCWIGAFTVIDGSGGLTIGKGCDISAGAQIYTHSTVNRVVSHRALGIERAATTIGSHVHVGAGAVVLMGCDIGDNCVIGAGAVVPQFTVVPAWSLLVGAPAKVILEGARRFAGPSSEL